MPETSIFTAEAAALERLTAPLTERGVGPHRLRQLVEAMTESLSVAAELIKTHPDHAERALHRIGSYLNSIAFDLAAVPTPDDGTVEVDPVVENPQNCVEEGCCHPFGHDGDHDFGEEE